MQGYKVDAETGEVQPLDVSELQEALNAETPPLENDVQAMTAYCERLGELIAQKLSNAKRLKDQAATRAKPLETSANWLFMQILPVVKRLAELTLRKNAEGKYPLKTLHLEPLSFSFRRAGGPQIWDEKSAIEWCVHNADPDFQSCVHLEHKLDNKKLLVALTKKNIEVPFVQMYAVEEFANCKPVLPKAVDT